MAITNLNQTVYANVALEAFTQALAPITAFSTNFMPEPVEKGATVKVAYIGTQSGALDFSGQYTVQDADANGIDVAINKHKYVSWSHSDTDLANMGQIQAEKFFKNKGYELAKAVFQDILSVATTANYANEFETSVSGFSANSVIDISTEADLAGIPDFGRALILNPELHAKVRKDLKAADGFGSDVVMREGKVPSLDTFEAVYKTSMIPDNSEDLIGLAAHSDAIATAIRYLKPQDGHTNTEAFPLTDEDTKITLGYRSYYDNSKGSMVHVLEANYGYVKGNPNGIVRLVEV